MTGGAVWVSRFYGQYTGTSPTNAQLTTFDAAVAAAITSRFVSLMTSAVNVTGIQSTDLTSPTGAVDTSAPTIVGTRAGGVMPAEVSFVASYLIARRYRGGHPRGYWPFGSETDLFNPRVWVGTFPGIVQTALTNFFADVATAGAVFGTTYTHVNVSYYQGFTVVINPLTGRARNVPKLRVGGPVVDGVTSVIGRTTPGVQRRRQAFIG
jgi:hypothetical protein